MPCAAGGDRVTVHYIGTLDNGRIFDQRDSEQPLTFTLGDHEIFPALEKEIVGMAVGAVKNIRLCAADAFGLRSQDNLIKVSRQIFPPERPLRIGEKLQIELGGQSVRQMRIRQVSDQDVLLDGNHDLAGCDLTFALQLVAIEKNPLRDK
ncbi:MAG: FKBP-type peptidyl-prolyl cis-trans isomerase [Deltaproteobacteria bacterium]|jgi:FKBP-type peptidyl-prolyl cis-trans isomerase 2|nr:FKBP-type peptidyl-prolyl cis-trans isomerase [Deltaproteobacteria bacterium]